ncbi:MAG: homoserine dehydrogenase, partial [Clostridia bacterium]|nr:homoserine dehydrogenase [Clostridia bacterium]
MKTVKVAIIGMGTVGGGTYDLLTANHDKILSSYGLDVQIKKVLDKDEQKLANKVKPEQVCRSLDEILADEEISIVVEVMGGVEPAKTFITKIMQSGKSVVTANKELISKQWADLERVARENGVGLYFEASCVGGVPIIRTLNESLQGDNIKSIMGIINGTTNYILTKMTEEGMSYEEALAQAQQLGYAEFNPTADVDGYDAMYKLSILSSLAFHTCIPYTSIYREGITKVSQDDIAFGKNTGYKIKLLAIGKKKDNDVEVRVHPTLIAENHPLASVSGAFNAVFLNGDFVDDVMLYGRGAGAYPTGSAIVSDVIYCALKTSHVYTDFENDGKVSEDINIVSDYESKYYVNLIVD